MTTPSKSFLLAALDGGYAYEPYKMLDWFLSCLLSLWGLEDEPKVPDDAKAQIVQAVEEYSKLVHAFEPFHDILGDVYMELRGKGSRAHLGQFFTPWHIASMMAQMTLGERPPSDGKLLRACDPCCGSGVMMLAFLNTVYSQWGADSLSRVSVTGCDLDQFCARMMAVQVIANCNVNNLVLGEVVVLHGNSLLPFDGMKTILHASAPEMDGFPAQHPARLEALSEAAATHSDVMQLELFEAA